MGAPENLGSLSSSISSNSKSAHRSTTEPTGTSHDELPCYLIVFRVAPNQLTTVGIYGAKKLVSFTKAFIRARKEASSETLVVDSSTGPGDEAEGQVEVDIGMKCTE